MKGVNFSCASPASAAIICTGTDGRSMVRPSTGGVTTHHRAPHVLRDHRRARAALINSATPHAPPRTRTRSHVLRKSRKSSSAADHHEPSDLIGGSSRYLLNDAAFFEALPGLEAPPPLISAERSKLELVVNDGEAAAVFKAAASATNKAREQVVHLRVSLHCKGCEGKVRKHISKMEGVTSFDIDFKTKKVTVVGEVTPLGVLNSISKVKNAQLWPSSL
ncbi:protein SODIUM POTASSIUM ROOT DEFECTIVE 2-like [Canna indica]|uniref:Protein SODIUM POTASSIUM ROOT DEFECTIVE 2-like n=1 Tax=Canna indica TaxID=4628 RepID=A0AAQ3KIH0_9LILI|nr:protein SODIUM POTASSIUM ROOT DEFECTIVE 2-like [Canna indica]